MYLASGAILVWVFYSYGSALLPFLHALLHRGRKLALKSVLLLILYFAPMIIRVLSSCKLWIKGQQRSWILQHVAYPEQRNLGRYPMIFWPLTDWYFKLDRVAYRLRYSHNPRDQVHICASTEYLVSGDTESSMLNEILRSSPHPPSRSETLSHELGDCMKLKEMLTARRDWLIECWLKSSSLDHPSSMVRYDLAPDDSAKEQEQKAVLIDVEYRQYNARRSAVETYRHFYVLRSDQDSPHFPPALPPFSKLRRALVWDASIDEVDVTEEVRQYSGPSRDFGQGTAQAMTLAHLQLALTLRHSKKEGSQLHLDMN